MVKLLYFMKLAELIGCSQDRAGVAAECLPQGDLLVWLGQRGEHYQAALADGSGLRTINKKFVDSASPVRDGDEIAFFPKGR